MVAEISMRESGFSVANPAAMPSSHFSEQPVRTQQKLAPDEKQTESYYSEQAKARLSNYAEKLNQVLDIFNYSIRFSLDDQSHQLIVKVVNSKTDEVIRQIPPESMLNLKHRLDEMVGLILDEKV